ncbi:hypothetical protein HPB51_007399 [Rhipicephalus microplus]|uniref:Endonuclease/exonuclease/phosphatase domain-containing protein n=1 Tax=Rhipicephalus microplus TaxID=6941 RepID=A0A9J6EYW1_RHIMP|nr:hypothetical protein HPB51_007399 [Rhipicephalus microplus]
MEPTLVLVERTLAWLRTRNIVAGIANAKHSAWGAQASNPRGSRLAEFAAVASLIPINDSAFITTYENKYSMSWIDVTLATSSVVAAGRSWRVRGDVTYSEHLYDEVAIGLNTATRNKQLAQYAREQLPETLSWEPWFDRVTGAQLQSADTLELFVTQFYHLFDADRRKHLRPAHGTRRGNSWRTSELAQERKCVNAM